MDLFLVLIFYHLSYFSLLYYKLIYIYIYIYIYIESLKVVVKLLGLGILSPICATSAFLFLLFLVETFLAYRTHLTEPCRIDKFIQLVANICCTHVQVISGINMGTNCGYHMYVAIFFYFCIAN